MPARRIVADNRAFFGLPGGTEREVFRNFGRYLGEFFSAEGDPDRLRSLMGTVDYSEVDKAAATGRGVAVVTAHFGNWEFGALALGRHRPGARVLMRTVGDPALDAVFRRCRGTTEMLDVAEGARTLARGLASGGVVAAAIDEPQEKGIEVLLCGRPVNFPYGFFRVVEETGALVVPTRCRRNREGRIDITALPPVTDASPQETAQAVASIFSAWIRDDPDQWLLMRRFDGD